MNSSAIWEIIALSHVLEARVITRGEADRVEFILLIHGDINHIIVPHTSA